MISQFTRDSWPEHWTIFSLLCQVLGWVPGQAIFSFCWRTFWYQNTWRRNSIVDHVDPLRSPQDLQGHANPHTDTNLICAIRCILFHEWSDNSGKQQSYIWPCNGVRRSAFLSNCMHIKKILLGTWCIIVVSLQVKIFEGTLCSNQMICLPWMLWTCTRILLFDITSK